MKIFLYSSIFIFISLISRLHEIYKEPININYYHYLCRCTYGNIFTDAIFEYIIIIENIIRRYLLHIYHFYLQQDTKKFFYLRPLLERDTILPCLILDTKFHFTFYNNLLAIGRAAFMGRASNLQLDLWLERSACRRLEVRTFKRSNGKILLVELSPMDTKTHD